jgi:hypothetical protein
MKTKFIIISTIFILQAQSAFCQTEVKEHNVFKHSFGLQANPGFRELSYIISNSDIFKIQVYAFRYGYQIKPFLKIGPELSFISLKFDDPRGYYLHSLTTKFGGFARGSLFNTKPVRLFAEISPYLSHTSSKGIYSNNQPFNNTINMFDGYVAPGISFFFIQQRLQFDLMFKFSKEINLKNNNQHGIISFRLNYNFNFSE